MERDGGSVDDTQTLVCHRHCVERIQTAWPGFLSKRVQRLQPHPLLIETPAEKVAEGILEDLFTSVLDWSAWSFNPWVIYRVPFVKSKREFRLMVLGLFLLQALALRASGQDLVEQELRIPAPGAGKRGLEAVVVRPNEPGSHPLALVNHGAPRAIGDHRKMTPWEMLPEAREFARRGWTTAIVMRRGYGDSGGDFAENARPCGRNPDYYGAGLESANDLRAAIAYLSKLPEVDPTRIISIGRSAGGFATVALTASPPAGLVAGINFAGGRGSPAKDEVCNPADLINAFRAFGKTSRVPMLWVYAQNDHFFPPQIAAEFYRAFTAGGGTVQFVSASPFGTDGHGLFSLAGVQIWASMVDAFLQSQNLVLRKTLLALPEPPGIGPPTQLSERGRLEFRQFLTLPMHRAFAVSASGQFGYSFGARTDKDAKRLAKERCGNSAGEKERCMLYIVDDANPVK